MLDVAAIDCLCFGARYFGLIFGSGYLHSDMLG